MTRLDFETFVQEHHLESEVSFAPNLQDGYCIRECSEGWEVFLLERGCMFDLIRFSDESDALNYLYGIFAKFVAHQ